MTFGSVFGFLGGLQSDDGNLNSGTSCAVGMAFGAESNFGPLLSRTSWAGIRRFEDRLSTNFFLWKGACGGFFWAADRRSSNLHFTYLTSTSGSCVDA